MVEKEKTEVICLDSFHGVGQIGASGADGEVGEGKKLDSVVQVEVHPFSSVEERKESRD